MGVLIHRRVGEVVLVGQGWQVSCVVDGTMVGLLDLDRRRTCEAALCLVAIREKNVCIV